MTDEPRTNETRTRVITCPTCDGDKGWWQNDGHDGREWRRCTCHDGKKTIREVKAWVRA